MVSFGNFENDYGYKEMYDNVMKELHEKYIHKNVAKDIIDEMLESITVEDSKKSVNCNETLEYNVYDNVSNTLEELDLVKRNINKEVEDIKEVVSEIAENAKEKIDETIKHTNNCMNEIKSRFTNRLEDFPYDEDKLNTSIHHVDSYEINKNNQSLKKDHKERKSFLSKFFSMFKFW